MLGLNNDGDVPFDPVAGYRIGSQFPQDNTTWGSARIELARLINPGEDVIFEPTFTAPTRPGLYQFAWQMLQEGVCGSETLRPRD